MNTKKERRTSQDTSAATRERRLTNTLDQYEISRELWDFATMAVQNAIFNIVIDDSGSMNTKTDLLKKNAHRYVRQRLVDQGLYVPTDQMTRWDEVEDRLHMMLDLCCYLPISEIRISFLNRATSTQILVNDSLDEASLIEMHKNLSEWFKVAPCGGTPLGRHMSNALKNTSQKVSHFFFSDGAPGDCSIDSLLEMVCVRKRPELNAITFVSCSDDDAEIGWMKDADEMAPQVAEIDDFATEESEVRAGQGRGFPFTRGIYLMCLLCAAYCKELDNLDEPRLLSPQFLSIFFGKEFTRRSAEAYFDAHPTNHAVAPYAHAQQKQTWMNALDNILKEQHQSISCGAALAGASTSRSASASAASASVSAASASRAAFFAANTTSSQENSMPVAVAIPVISAVPAPVPSSQIGKRNATEANLGDRSTSSTMSSIAAAPAPASAPVAPTPAAIQPRRGNGMDVQQHTERSQETSFCRIM